MFPYKLSVLNVCVCVRAACGVCVVCVRCNSDGWHSGSLLSFLSNKVQSLFLLSARQLLWTLHVIRESTHAVAPPPPRVPLHQSERAPTLVLINAALPITCLTLSRVKEKGKQNLTKFKINHNPKMSNDISQHIKTHMLIWLAKWHWCAKLSE